MAAYVVASLFVEDINALVAYQKCIAGVLARYQGEVVVSQPVKEVLEGDIPPGERTSVLRFPDEATARAYINSPEYQAGKQARQVGASMLMRLLVD
jgi:uncharacterized protein (DUF1330 family)